MTTPNVNTHVAVTAEIPREEPVLLTDRPNAPTPSLWQQNVKVRHRETGKNAVIVRVDWATNMFRAFYPDETDVNGKQGRFSERTEWQHCRDWIPETTFSPAELARQAKRQEFEAMISRLDAEQLALAQVLCDDEDPNKAMAKFQLMAKSGMIKLPAAAAEAVIETKPTRGEVALAEAAMQGALNPRGKK